MVKLFIFLYFFVSIIRLSAQDEYKPINLGKNINTEYAELRPLISPDGKQLFFVRSADPENTQINTTPDCQDIWYSTIDNRGNWTKAKHLAYPFNQRTYNAIFSISPDGNTMLIRDAYEKDMKLIKFFSVSHKTKTGWSGFQRQMIPEFDKLDQGPYDGAYISNDGKVLLMSLCTKKGADTNNIYISFSTKTNYWTKPKLLKAPINTRYDEMSPFLASDGKTLYFSSNRPGGLGSYDIYMTRRLDETWENWEMPVNMGSTINSDDWEAYYSLDATGEYAYMITYKNAIGEADIVKIKLKEELRPNPVVLIYGTVLNSKTNTPLGANINYEILPEGTNVGIAESDPITGDYKIILPYSKMYGLSASSTGFISVSDHIDLTEKAIYQEIHRDLFLTPIEVGQTIRLNNIFFDFGKATLRSESFSELNRIVVFMNENPNLEIELSGHTDNVGSDEANLQLSDDRAKAVCEYIINKNINAKRIIAKGFGETKPIASNDSEEGRQLNRRVEFTILKK